MENESTSTPEKTDRRAGNSGRKPAKDRRVHLNLYVAQSAIEVLGGKEKAQELAVNYLLAQSKKAEKAQKKAAKNLNSGSPAGE